jgi:predicted amidohydrolase
MASRFLAAACHVSPITLSAAKTTEKCISFINQAAKNSADLVVFPESYIPAFPVWSAIQAPTQNHVFFERMAKESIYIDGEEMHAIRDTAKQTGTVVSVGISEKVRYSTATMFNSNIIISSDGEILVHHRKLMPTFFEKLTWSPGDGHGLRVANTRFGKIGALICGENTNPLARYALMAQGEQVHISTWPAVWPTVVPSGNHGSRPRYDNVAANKTRAAAHCFENKCFGILCAGHLDEAALEVSLLWQRSRGTCITASHKRPTQSHVSWIQQVLRCLAISLIQNLGKGRRKRICVWKKAFYMPNWTWRSAWKGSNIMMLWVGIRGWMFST